MKTTLTQFFTSLERAARAGEMPPNSGFEPCSSPKWNGLRYASQMLDACGRRFTNATHCGTSVAAWATVVFLLFCGSVTGALAQALTWQSAIRAGGTTADDGTGIAVDAAGNKYVTGFFTVSATFGGVTRTSAGVRDMFLAKYNAANVLQWVNQAGGAGLAGASGAGVAIGPAGNVYVTGTFRGPVSFNNITLTSIGTASLFVAQYNPQGTLVWVEQVAGGMTLGYDSGIAADNAGNSYVTGRFLSLASFGSGISLTPNGPADAFFAKYDPNGAFQWARKAGCSFIGAARSIAVDGEGNPCAVGIFYGTLTLGAPAQVLTSAGGANMFIVKFDTFGNPLWANQTSGTEAEDGEGIAVDPTGNFYVTSYFAGTASFGSVNGNPITVVSDGPSYNYFIAKYDSSGAAQWATKGGGLTGTDDETRAIAVDAQGNSFVTGFQGGINRYYNSGNEVFVAKYDTSGTLQWKQVAGGSPDNIGRGIAVDSLGGVHVTGYFTGVATFGSLSPLSSSGIPASRDIFVAKLGPCITITTKEPLTLAHANNHKFENITVADMVSSVVDNCGHSLGVDDVVITHATSDEAASANGSGNTPVDIVIAADCKSVQVLRERAGSGDGRVYTIWFKVTDASGNRTNGSFRVFIPQGGSATDSGVNYTVTGNCFP